MRGVEMRGLFCLSLAAGTFFLSSLAPAADSDSDVVMLSNGGRLRGIVIEQDPQSGVRIKLLDGTLRTLKPAEVRQVRYHDEAASPAIAAPAAPPDIAPAAPVLAPPPVAAPVLPPSDAQPALTAPPLAPSASEPQTSPASAQTSSSGGHRFDIGVRLGYAVPMGHLTGGGVVTDATMTTTTYLSPPMSDVIASKLPILFEAGYEVTPNIVLGVHFQYAVLIDKDGPSGCPSGFSCSDHDIEIGIQGQYHFSPGHSVDPWLGIGLGYEFESYSSSGTTTDPNSGTKFSSTSSGTLKGPQYLKLQGGLDCLAAQAITLGPFISFSVAEYTSSTNGGSTDNVPFPSTTQDVRFTALHEWLTLGVKGAFRIGND